MRVEVFDEDGNRYTVSIDGRVTRDKALRILDMVELLGGLPGIQMKSNSIEGMTKIERVLHIAEKHFPLVWFSTKEIKMAYEDEIGEKVNLSTVSTYLSRLAKRGMLLKTKDSNNISYRLLTKGVKQFIRTK